MLIWFLFCCCRCSLRVALCVLSVVCRMLCFVCGGRVVVGRCSLFVVCCWLLFGVCRMSRIGCASLIVVRCALCVVSCSLMACVGCCLLLSEVYGLACVV